MTKQTKTALLATGILVAIVTGGYFFWWKPKQEKKKKLEQLGQDEGNTPTTQNTTSQLPNAIRDKQSRLIAFIKNSKYYKYKYPEVQSAGSRIEVEISKGDYTQLAISYGYINL